MAVAGLRGTGDWATDERPKNFREMILWRNPNGKAPMTALMGKGRSESVDDPEFSWWEEEQNPIRVQNSAALNTTATTVTIASGGGDAQDLVEGDILLVEITESETSSVYAYENEIVVVRGNPSATTAFNIVRGQAGTTAATIATNAYLTKIGNIFAEGGTSPNASTRNPTKLYNYAGISKTAYRITRTAKKTRTRTGDPLKNDKKRKMFDHSVALEYKLLFSKRHEASSDSAWNSGTSNGKPARFPGGLLYFLAAEDASSTHACHIWTTSPTVDTFLDNSYQMFDYNVDGGGGDERLVFCGNGYLNKLNKLVGTGGNDRINYDGPVKVYGMNFQRWILPQGTLYFKSHPLLNVHGKFTNSAFFVNPAGVIWRYIDDTHSQENIQANDADETKGQWLTEGGPEFHHLKTMQYQGNFTV